MSYILDCILQNGARDSNTVAFKCGPRTLTYESIGRLLADVRGTATAFKGCRVLLLIPDGTTAYLTHVFCSSFGATLVPVSIRITGDKLKDICVRIRPEIVITNVQLEKRHAEVFRECLVLAVGPDLEASEYVSLVNNIVTSVKARFARGSRNEEDVGMVVFTSGSTGVPKGVCLSAENIIAASRSNVYALKLQLGRSTVATVPHYDYYGFIQIYSHILAMATLTMGLSTAFPADLFASISAGATDLVLVPHSLRELLRLVRKRAVDSLAAVDIRWITTSSDILDDELVDNALNFFPHVTLVDVYGLTEAGRASFRYLCRGAPFVKTLGSPGLGVAISLEDTKNGVGEVVITGPNVMRGYLTGLEQDIIQYNSVAIMRTGDLGQNSGTGIVLVGRKDHMINVNGEKIHPIEIERLAVEIRGVKDALAWPRKDAHGNISIVLDIFGNVSPSETPEVLSHFRGKVPSAFVPKEIRIVDHIARTELGSKLIRKSYVS